MAPFECNRVELINLAKSRLTAPFADIGLDRQQKAWFLLAAQAVAPYGRAGAAQFVAQCVSV
jgi:hypothetical protein